MTTNKTRFVLYGYHLIVMVGEPPMKRFSKCSALASCKGEDAC